MASTQLVAGGAGSTTPVMWTRSVLFVAVVVWTMSAGGLLTNAAPSPKYAPFTACGSASCDLRTHYCDQVLDSCARCDDDCNPSRISGDEFATNSCKQKCQWYYVFSAMVPLTAPSTTVELNPGVTFRLTGAPVLNSGWEQRVMPVIIFIILLMVIIILILVVIMAFTYVCRSRRPIRVVCEDQSMHRRPVDDTSLLEKSEKRPLTGVGTNSFIASSNGLGDGSSTRAKILNMTTAVSGTGTTTSATAEVHHTNSMPPLLGSPAGADTSTRPLLSLDRAATTLY